MVQASGRVTVTNSVIGAPVNGGNNCVGTLTSLGHNLESGASCGLGASGDISNTNPLLGPLQNNGGSTLTRGLLTNSQALDAGNDLVCPATDQRGISRPQGPACDIGAYEVIGYSNSVTQTIGGQACITSTLFISNSYLAGDLLVGVNLAFEPRGDLRVNLYSPYNAQVNLLGNTGGNGQNLDVLWNQTSTAGPVGTENHDVNFPFYKYERVPDHSLSPLFGRGLHGAWRLAICNVGVNTGTLNRWTLIVPSIGNPRVLLPLVRR
jgi:subtilisin-like proprotein convertase family protein